MRYIASVSFGKDSLAMLLRLLEENKPLDEIVFYDTGMEFNATYNIRDKVKVLLQKKGIKYTELKPKCDFCYLMTEKPVKKRNGTIQNGYQWCGGRCRWGTTEKLKALDKYCKGCYEYVGIAGDEWKRLVGIFDFDMEEYTDRKGQVKKRPILDENKCIKNFKQISKFNKIYPLVHWEMNEQDCLNYCRQKGFSWEEDGVDLYDILDRVSCWCCANKNLKELKNYYIHLPEYWEKLKGLQNKIDRPFKPKYTIFDLEERFKQE